jgi:hypothetical protein
VTINNEIIIMKGTQRKRIKVEKKTSKNLIIIQVNSYQLQACGCSIKTGD